MYVLAPAFYVSWLALRVTGSRVIVLFHRPNAKCRAYASDLFDFIYRASVSLSFVCQLYNRSTLLISSPANLPQLPYLRVLTSPSKNEQHTPDVANRSDEHSGIQVTQEVTGTA
jgi:hypothetical protein